MRTNVAYGDVGSRRRHGEASGHVLMGVPWCRARTSTEDKRRHKRDNDYRD